MIDRDFLYNLLPEYHRNRDAYQRQQLRAFMRIFQGPLDSMHTAIERLYDDWFIETCEDAAIPLIARLVGVEVFPYALGAIPSQRALVANALVDRQRKGTLGALQSALSDASGWPVRVVESRRRVATMADLQFEERPPSRSALLRFATPDAYDEAFETYAHSVRLRSSPEENAPVFRPSSVDVFVWSAPVRPLDRVRPRRLGRNRYAFHPLGADTPLFRAARVAHDRYVPLEPNETPAPIGRGRLQRELDRGAASLDELSIAIESGEPPTLFSPNSWFVADLSSWLPEGAFPEGREVAIDPELGRFQLRGVQEPVRLWVSFVSGAAMPPRTWLEDESPSPEDIQEVPKPLSQRPPRPGRSLANRMTRPHRERRVLGNKVPILEPRPYHRRIRLLHSGDYSVSEVVVNLVEGDRLAVSAAPGVVPVLRGILTFSCPVGQAEVSLSGLWFDAMVVARGGVRLSFSDCVFLPSPIPSLIGLPETAGDAGKTETGRPTIRVVGSIVGPIQADGQLDLIGSIVDGGGGTAIRGRATLSTAGTTILGDAETYALPQARSTLFGGRVRAERTDLGFVESCFVPEGSHTPPRERCFPARGDEGLLQDRRPPFRTTLFGQPGYARLSPFAPPQLLTGGNDDSEMGTFGRAFEELRRSELRRVAREFLPLGMDAQFVYET